jgi:hypothetical protein
VYTRDPQFCGASRGGQVMGRSVPIDRAITRA